MPGDHDIWWTLNFYYGQFFVKPPYPTKSFEGKTVIVTGSNVGLGFEAVHHFVRLGAAKVIIACRTVEKGEDARTAIEQSTGRKGVIEVWQLDLSHYDSVKQFAARAKKLPRLDCLVENAGIASWNFEKFGDTEAMLTVNVISTFLLAFLLMPKLKETAEKFATKPVLTIVSSDTHYWVDFDEAKLPDGTMIAAMSDEKQTNIRTRYPTTKLMEVFMVREMAARHPDGPVTINAANPGLCHSSLARNFKVLAFQIYKLLVARTTEVGSRTLVHGASSGSETHGEYLQDCRVRTPATVVVHGKGQATQKKVWREVTAKLEEIEPGVTAGW